MLLFFQFTIQIFPEKATSEQENVISGNRSYFSCTKGAMCHRWGLQLNHATVWLFLSLWLEFLQPYVSCMLWSGFAAPNSEWENPQYNSGKWDISVYILPSKGGKWSNLSPFCTTKLLFCGGWHQWILLWSPSLSKYWPCWCLILEFHSLKKSSELLFITNYPFSYIWLQWHKQALQNNVVIEFYFTKKQKHRLRLECIFKTDLAQKKKIRLLVNPIN